MTLAHTTRLDTDDLHLPEEISKYHTRNQLRRELVLSLYCRGLILERLLDLSRRISQSSIEALKYKSPSQRGIPKLRRKALKADSVF